MSFRRPHLARALSALSLASSLALVACGPEKDDDSDTDTSSTTDSSTADGSTAGGSTPGEGLDAAEVCRTACEHFRECNDETDIDDCSEDCIGTAQYLADGGGMCDRFYLNWVVCRGELTCDEIAVPENDLCDEAGAGLEYCAIE